MRFSNSFSFQISELKTIIQIMGLAQSEYIVCDCLVLNIPTVFMFLDYFIVRCSQLYVKELNIFNHNVVVYC